MMVHDKHPLKSYNPKDLPFGPRLTTQFAGQCDKLSEKTSYDVPLYIKQPEEKCLLITQLPIGHLVELMLVTKDDVR